MKKDPVCHWEVESTDGYFVRRCSVRENSEGAAYKDMRGDMSMNPKYVTCKRCLALMEQDNNSKKGN